MLSTIWNDINYNAEAIVICDTKYNPTSLSNFLYDSIHNRTKRRNLDRKNKKLRKEHLLIKEHLTQLSTDENISLLILSLFKREEIPNISDVDRLFLNSYYRRLLRAKIERDYIGKELVPGLIVTTYTDYETDRALVETLRYLRIICNYLGLSSTTVSSSFPFEKLYHPNFWNSLSGKFVSVFGEERITPIDVPIDENVSEKEKLEYQLRVLMFLNIVFNTWSGSTLVLDNLSSINNEILPSLSVNVIPATFVTRMVDKLR